MAEGGLRILHLPIDLGGHARALAASQRRLGHRAVSASLERSPYGFDGDLCSGRPFGDPWRLPAREAGRWRLFWRSLVAADVIHCHFGRTLGSVRAFPLREPGRAGPMEALTLGYARLLWLRDLRLWRRLGKRVAMTFYGDDIRPVALALQRNPWTHLAEPALRAALEPRDAAKAALAATLAQHGVVLFATNPDLLAALPPGATFLPYGHVDPSAHAPRPPAEDGTLRLLHLPTDQAAKGTALFAAAVAALREAGAPVELTILERLPNATALAAIAAHDVLLDQLRVGWFGAVAVEAMAMGKPVVAYLNPLDEALLPGAYRAALPVLRADPADIGAVLGRLVALPRAALDEIGARGRAFVQAWHHPDAVARQVLQAYGPGGAPR